MPMVKPARCAAAVVCLIAGSLLGRAALAQTVAAYVLLGPDGARIARVVTEADRCPTLSVDGKPVTMTVRSPAETIPQRPTASKPELSKPSAFPALTCEAAIPAGTQHAKLGGAALPLPPATIRRIVVIGDTGCRIKAADNAVQSCNDPKEYPFAKVAAAAAAWKPDIVLHVGDYLYRENPCPEGMTICSGTPWGYGLDAWQADFFSPAKPLLRVAPWAMVRGNHESCNRSGQGWQRFFDPYPFTTQRSCDDPANDIKGNFTEPYAVPLGQDAQIVLWDTADAADKPFEAGDPRIDAYTANVKSIFALAQKVPHTILSNHHPVLAVAAKKGKDGNPPRLAPGNLSLQDILSRADPQMYPAGIDLLLSGHVHVWEQLSFGGRYPSQFVTGFSGTLEDIVPLPETLPADAEPAPGAVATEFSSWVDGFGFMTLERTGDDAWKAEIHDRNGKVVGRCAIKGRISKCGFKQAHGA